ncbi:MAG: 4-oxalomesaconate tautomerase [Betaproteobacteria bacterium]|nr:4-oxalomesaconate tautomerase [Betaproteobacteria bacterium]
MLTAIPCIVMRGGTSKGPFFIAADLPADAPTRDRVLLAAMGSPDSRQIDGLGGADPLTSKVGIVARSERPGVDLDFLFGQVLIDEGRVDTTPNCGNMLAAAGPFALERGLVQATGGLTKLRILTLNTGMVSEVSIETPAGRVNYEGQTRIDGVPGTAAPIPIVFLDVAGSVCGSLLPTGNVADVIDGVRATCIDNGMPVVVMRAEAFGLTGYESRDELNANRELKARIEAIRLPAGRMMNLGDVARKVVPKMSLVAPPRTGGSLCSRTFIPHECHAAVGVLGAVTLATAAVLPGSVAHGVADVPKGDRKLVSIEHPSGEFSIELTTETAGGGVTVKQAALLRTARMLMRGEVFVPASVWAGHR